MSDERVRLFVALDLPEDVKEALIRWRELVVAKLLASAAGRGEVLRPIAPDALHVTLCFLGSQPAAAVKEIARACDAAVSGQRQRSGSDAGGARVSIGSGLWLPARRPRVLAVHLEDRDGVLAAAQRALSTVLAAGGWYRPKARPFLAHISVARVVKGGRVSRDLLELDRLAGLPGADFVAQRVVLFRSRLGARGAEYEALHEVGLS